MEPVQGLNLKCRLTARMVRNVPVHAVTGGASGRIFIRGAR